MQCAIGTTHAKHIVMQPSRAVSASGLQANCLELTMSGFRGGADGLLSCGDASKSSMQTGHDSEGYC